MSHSSSIRNKSICQFYHEELGLSREKATELLESIPPERIERFESSKVALNELRSTYSTIKLTKTNVQQKCQKHAVSDF